MIQSKRSSYSIDHGTVVSLATKRHKADISISAKDVKEKFGERISTLQQLVSPFGKTDTASVLLEAMEYIQFLQEQVKIYDVTFQVCSYIPYGRLLYMVEVSACGKVLSAPYLQCSPAIPFQEWEQYSLRSRGLCLMPISCTEGVAQTNGADMWAPMKTTSPCPRLDKAAIPQFPQ